MIQRLLLAVFSLLLYTCSFAQGEPVEMADTMRSNGKIYVVLAVVVTIFTGIIIYLIRLDKKITRLEKTTRT